MKSILFISAIDYEGKNRWGRTYPLAKAFANNGFKTTLLVSQKIGFKLYKKEIKDNVEIISFNFILPLRIRRQPIIGLFTSSFLFRLIFAIITKYDYVYSDCGEIPCSGIPCRISQILHNSIYLSEYGDLLGKGGYYDSKPLIFKILFGWYYLWSIRYFRQIADYVVVLSSTMKNYVINNMGIDDNKVLLLPGGASPNIIKYKPKHASIPIKLGYIGIDNSEIKGILPILQSITEYAPNQFIVYVFGNKLSKDVLSFYKIDSVIKECGWVDVVHGQDIIKDIDIFLLMRSDIHIGTMGWPNKLGDYLSYGRPVIITPYGDLIDFVKKHKEGFIIVDRNDKKDTRNILFNIIDGKYDLTKMGEYNRHVAENEISWDARVKNIINII